MEGKIDDFTGVFPGNHGFHSVFVIHDRLKENGVIPHVAGEGIQNRDRFFIVIICGVALGVNERNLKQRQASLGLTDSGLTASQQTAIQVSRGNADAKISAQKQAAIDSITLQLEQYLAQIEQNRANTFAEIDYNLNTTNTNLYNTLMSQAYSNQAALDAANAQAEATREAARIAAAEKAAAKNESNFENYYTKAKYLLENSGEGAAKSYIASLNIDDDAAFSLMMSLGIESYIDETPKTPYTPTKKDYMLHKRL